MDEITIHVMDEDIAEGRRADSEMCAIALAAKRELFNNTVTVCYTWIAFMEDETCTVWSLPEEAREFISNFDSDFPVEPFKFTLDKKVSCIDAS